jgi:hypothetical protein
MATLGRLPTLGDEVLVPTPGVNWRLSVVAMDGRRVSRVALAIGPTSSDPIAPGAASELVQAELVRGELVEAELVEGELVQGELVRGELVQAELVQGEVVQAEPAPAEPVGTQTEEFVRVDAGHAGREPAVGGPAIREPELRDAVPVPSTVESNEEATVRAG